MTGKSLLAIEVFSLLLRALKRHMQRRLLDQYGLNIESRDIKWVLIVPAIWPGSVKQFMRKSAEKVYRIQ